MVWKIWKSTTAVPPAPVEQPVRRLAPCEVLNYTEAIDLRALVTLAEHPIFAVHAMVPIADNKAVVRACAALRTSIGDAGLHARTGRQSPVCGCVWMV